MLKRKKQPTEPSKPMPLHVAVIMDGNGRWAKARGLPREEGHRQGVENVKKIVECAQSLDLRYLTLYAFSVENWNRPKHEVNALMRLLESFLKSQATDLVEKKIRFRVIGRLQDMPKRVGKLLEKTIEETKDFDQWTLSLALNYGSRTEMLDAVQSYAKAVQRGSEDPDALNWETLQSYLYTGNMPDPDLVIRTSGEHRISNFLLMQSAYAEYYFARENWPDFGPECFRRAIDAYCARERRFGLTGEQIQSPSS
ncbi:di-trans,poly-cis-decaprenylcistransferase [Puniceicoccales bacterium CK1056]|uniref:Isoprenyl transferase n=1 Tax=Oceanipulchritudo coccoides TaxID=2706888 RepID=A0A6B2M1Z4_9BACT|nr:polyprenyl diphosphate synthase [Oceanipulchritudo coccoides]NDV62753.1 di-trans,poly-cis-decaprenylcistransferase [Oceanipulchritudo coccoides]